MMTRAPHVKANEIRLKRQSHYGSFVLVEGRDDRLFLQQFADSEECRITVANGKKNVVEVVEILEADRFPGIVGIVDADFDHFEGSRLSSDNLVVLETVDLEALLIRSTALDRVLVELGSTKKIAGFGRDVREALVGAAVWIGCLRLHSRRNELRLKFKNLKYSVFVDKRSLTTRNRDLVRAVMNLSQRPDLSLEGTARKIGDICFSLDDPWLVCYGADMVRVLAFGLRQTLGTNRAAAVAPCVVRRYLRLAFQWSDMNNSRLGRDMREWEVRNSGYRVLGPE